VSDLTYAESRIFLNPQSKPQNAMSCTTCVYLGSLHALVSRCKTKSCQIHTVEVTGSNPVAPTNISAYRTATYEWLLFLAAKIPARAEQAR